MAAAVMSTRTTLLPSSGKAFGQLKKQQEEELLRLREEFPEVTEEDFQTWKNKFIEIDTNNSGDIDEMELKYMFEKLGQPKTHLEIQKMIKEVDTTNKGTICFRDFIIMMTGKKSSVLQKILMFEQLSKPKESPKTPPPKRSVHQLP